jgi:hypothetical protein
MNLLLFIIPALVLLSKVPLVPSIWVVPLVFNF